MSEPTEERLLAIDMGLRAGLAVFGRDGKLIWYRSRNYGNRSRLKKAAYSVLNEAAPISVVTVEGGGEHATPWTQEIERRGLRLIQIGAERWRKELLLNRQQRHGVEAKYHADTLARKIIQWSGAKRPTSLRHDAAEAICIGFWSVQYLGWLKEVPPQLKL